MTQPPTPRPTDAELGILRVLWSKGPCTVRQVHDVLASGRELAYTTVLKLLRTRTLAAAQVAEPATVSFGSNGMPSPFGTAAEIDLVEPGATCSEALRCPRLRIDGGGAIHLCANKLSCS